MDAFEELDVWKRGSRLCVTLLRHLSTSREWGFRDQVSRSALSIPSNIAEGYERSSRKEYVQFLRFAKGSCGELRAQLYVGKEAGLVDRVLARDLIQETKELSRILGAMIAKLSAADKQGQS